MDLTFSCKNHLWIFLVMSILCSMSYSWRISQKCPHGHYYNDGCTACWCDGRTGTRCEKLSKCARLPPTAIKCPRGRHYKDHCGNDCTCYDTTGAVFCNEKRHCPPILPPPPPIMQSPGPNEETFSRRDGLAMTGMAVPHVDIGLLALPTATPNPLTYVDNPHHTGVSSIYDKISVSSTPHPHVRIPNRSQELIIEPAIIIRKKGSNKASVVRNPSSATSVTLSSSSRHHDPVSVTPSPGTSEILLHQSPKSSSRAAHPLHLYEKQLKTIMDIKKAYQQLFHSKLSVNWRFPQKNTDSNLPFSKFVVLQENPSSTTEHPRRFDSDYDNSTFLTHTTASTYPKPLYSTYQPFWRRPEIKSAMKQFSPVPPLKQLVNFVSSSTETYLSNMFNLGNKNTIPRQDSVGNYEPLLKGGSEFAYETTTVAPLPSAVSPIMPFSYDNLGTANQWQYSPTNDPFQKINQYNHEAIPVHHIYQSHDYSTIMPLASTTPQPSVANYPDRHNGGYQYPLYYPSQLDKRKESIGNSLPPHRFPYMTELMQEIVRSDHMSPVQSSTPRLGLTASPTFQTPGPPYAEVDVVQPLSFLPPPKPEPATPTHRSFIVRQPPHVKHRHPQNHRHFHPPPHNPHHFHRHNVRVNMDKPIYLQPPPGGNRRVSVRPPPYQVHHQFIPPKPKQYRLVLKGGIRENAVKMDDVVPRFVSRIAHEFFKKPEIYVPKIRPGKPLTLEKVVLNHKELVPKEVVFHPGASPTKLRFTPDAHWQMKSDMAKHGIMMDEPLSPVRDYAQNDPNVMEMDAPINAVQTFEKHTNMEAGNYPEYGEGLENAGLNYGGSDNVNVQQHSHQLNQNLPPQPTPLPSPSPTQSLVELFQQHQLLQQQLNQQQQQQQLHQQQQEQLDQHQQQEQFHRHQQQHSDSQQYNHHVPPRTPHVPPTPTAVTETLMSLAARQHELIRQLQQLQQHQQSLHHIPPQPSPEPVLSVAQQHQLLQQQLMLAHQNQQAQSSSASASLSDADNRFHINPHDMDDFKTEDHDLLPKELDIPGVQQVVVDKYMVHDPMDPRGQIVFSTTTVSPPLHDEHAYGSMSVNPLNIHRSEVGPTPSSISVRHHGAPSPTPSSKLGGAGNYMVAVVNTTPSPPVTSTLAPQFQYNNPNGNHEPSLVSQIQDFLSEQMDFGAKPNVDLFEMMLHSRSGAAYGGDESNDRTDHVHNNPENESVNDEVLEDQIANETKVPGEVETDGVASMFSMDYKNKFNQKPPKVIVIKVPMNHTDGPFPKVLDKRGGEEIEIVGGSPISNKTASLSSQVKKLMKTSTENIIPTTTSRSVDYSDSNESSLEDSQEILTARQRRKKNRKRRRKKKRRNRNRNYSRNHDRLEELDMDDYERPKKSKTRKKLDLENEPIDKKLDNSSEASEDKSVTANDPNEDKNGLAEQKFQVEIDWKSHLMANICEINPTSPLCLTYRSICLLMTDEEAT